jgi:hypothetical protein
MSDEVKISLFGIEELDKFFEGMKRADQRRLIINAFRIGSKPLIEASRMLLKSRIKTRSTKTLQKSLGFVAGRSSGKSVFVSAKVGARRYGNYKGYHGHLFDAGTKPRQTKQGFNRGEMPASNFFTDALKQTENQMINSSQDDMLKSLDKLIQRNLKKVKTPC